MLILHILAILHTFEIPLHWDLNLLASLPNQLHYSQTAFAHQQRQRLLHLDALIPNLFRSAAFIGVGGLAANFFLLFQMTHDTGLLLLMNCFLWLGIVKCWNGPGSWKRAIAWGAFGGMAALCSPLLGLVWAVVTVWRFLCGKRKPSETLAAQQELRPPALNHSIQNTKLVHLAIAALVSILVVTPWTIRNYLVFHRFIPIKSNGMFELWQAQCADDDGIFDLSTARNHPFSGGVLLQEYAALGEIAFIDAKGELVKQAIQDNPMDFIGRVGNRFMAAFVYYSPFNKLDEYNRPWPLFLKRLVFPLPLISLYVILLLAPKPLPPQVSAAIAIWILTLIPYVLVSYYERYATPLLLPKLIIILYAWSLIQSRWNRDSGRLSSEVD